MGSLVLVEGAGGAGSTEFVLAVLRDAARRGGRARFLSALRSPTRIAREIQGLLDEDPEDIPIVLEGATRLTQAIRRYVAQAAAVDVASMRAGDALAIESVSALHHGGTDLASFAQTVGDAAAETGGVVFLLHASGSVPSEAEAVVREHADAHFVFAWRDGGSARRLVLAVPKMRGLAPLVEGDGAPVFEVELHRRQGFLVSDVKSVL